MNIYVIQVRAGREGKFIDTANEMTRTTLSFRFHWPRRELTIRKKGVFRDTISAIFPGYVFLEARAVTAELLKTLKKVPGFIRFLRSNQEILPLSDRDLELIKRFLEAGEIVRKSLVSFTAHQHIQIVDGPLKGLEGMIVKVDKRKKRIKVRLELYEDSFLIDFGFEAVEKYTEPGGKE